MSMLGWLLLLWPALRYCIASSSECSSTDTPSQCTVDKGYAICNSTDVYSSIGELAACTTRLRLQLMSERRTGKMLLEYHVEWNTLFQSLQPLPALSSLTLTVDRASYMGVRLHLTNTNSTLPFSKLKELQINVWLDTGETHGDWTTSLASLQVLDLSRAFTLGLDNARNLFKTLPLVEKLILRNVQSISTSRYSPRITLSDYICVGNVRYVDLGYNDIVVIKVSGSCWNTKLEVLDLRHNLLADLEGGGGPKWLALLESLVSLRELNIDYCSSSTRYHEGLWEDTDSYLESSEHNKVASLYIPSKGVHNTLLTVLSGYGYWLEDIPKYCGNIKKVRLAQCIALGKGQDICSFLNCLAPNFSLDVCRADPRQAFPQFALQYCDDPVCANNVAFPLPRYLRTISMRDFGRYVQLTNKEPAANETVLCFDPHNSLETVDLTNSKFNYISFNLGLFTVRGLKRLRFFSIQGCQLPFVINPLSFSDMESLTEAHVGGNKLSEKHVLPAAMFQSNIQLRVLNLSYANLIGVEGNAFVKLRKLVTLDLSHNRLDESSLAALDLSSNNLSYLDLSFNYLTSIPALFRRQIDKWEAAQLHLAGNNFLCNCDHLDFLHWIQSSTSLTFPNASEHACADVPGNSIHDIKLDSLYCDWHWQMPVIIVGGASSIFLLVVAVFVLYRKRWFIRNIIFRMRERLSREAQETPNRGYVFDAFVLYSSVPDDRLWVHYKLVSVLEKTYGFRLCIHHRNFPGGFNVADTIEQAILSSRKVIVVMSDNFLNSRWCIEEVQVTLSVESSKLLVIMYSDVTRPNVHMPTEIRQLLENKSYIEWGEHPQAQQLFWRKLTKALYSKYPGTAPSQDSANHFV